MGKKQIFIKLSTVIVNRAKTFYNTLSHFIFMTLYKVTKYWYSIDEDTWGNPLAQGCMTYVW